MERLDFKNPIPLSPTRAWRTYLGGKMISRLHGEDGEDGHFPEEWLMSTVSARNVGREGIVEGLTHIRGTDMTLREAIEQFPREMLGRADRKSLGVLVKLLDAAERLTLQVHPTRERAKELFSSPFGKTECWHILDTRETNGETPCLYLGFREGVTREYWQACFEKQDIAAMLACLHRIEVKRGDTYIVRGGVPHGIGAGCFLVEIQEPTDYTVRTERVTPSGLAVADEMCHQGLGFDKMFDCFEYDGADLETTLSRYRVQPQTEEGEGYTLSHIIYPAVTDMFALDLITVRDSVSLSGDGRFCGLYVLSGKGTLNGEPLNKCDHLFVPAAADELTVAAEGDTPLVLLRFYGPEATA